MVNSDLLVARCESLKSGNLEEVQRISDLLDDIYYHLLCRRTKMFVFRMEYFDNQMERLYFRRDKVIPKPLEDFWLNKLIEPEDLLMNF